MTAAEEASIERWMGSVDARLGQLIKDSEGERSGSTLYRREMRKRLARVERQVLLLDRDVKGLKELAPAVEGLKDGETRKNARLTLLVPAATVSAAVAATVIAQFAMKALHLI